MQIEEDSCYIGRITSSDEKSVFLTHIQEIWENGYSSEDYIINLEYIYFEDASYSGCNPNQKTVGTYIMKKQFLRWTKQIQQAKETAVKMLQKTATPINRDIKVGDTILYTWVNDEEDEDYRYDDEYYGLRVVEIKNDNIFAQSVYIGEHHFDSADELDWVDEPLDDIRSRSCLITAEAFMATHDYIRNFCRQLLDEIKSHAEITEQI